MTQKVYLNELSLTVLDFVDFRPKITFSGVSGENEIARVNKVTSASLGYPI